MRQRRQPTDPPAFPPEVIDAFTSSLGAATDNARSARALFESIGRDIATRSVLSRTPAASHGAAVMTGFVLGCLAMERFHATTQPRDFNEASAAAGSVAAAAPEELWGA